jgi:hypothetical protein
VRRNDRDMIHCLTTPTATWVSLPPVAQPRQPV